MAKNMEEPEIMYEIQTGIATLIQRLQAALDNAYTNPALSDADHELLRFKTRHVRRAIATLCKIVDL